MGKGDTADTAHTVRLPDVLLRRFFSCNSRNYYLGILPRRKKFRETRNEVLQFVNFPRNAKKYQVVNIDRNDASERYCVALESFWFHGRIRSSGVDRIMSHSLIR